MPVLAIGNMNKLDFHKHLQNSASGPVLTTAELERLVERYPYFQTAQILLTKAYLTDGDYRQTDQVQQAALYAGDRSALYHLLRATTHPGSENIAPLHTPTAPNVPVDPEPVAPLPTPSIETTDSQLAQPEPIESTDPLLRELADRIVEDQAPEQILSPPAMEDQEWIADTAPLPSPSPVEVVAPVAPPEATIADESEHPVPPTTPPAATAAANDPELQETILIEAIHSALEQEILEDVRQQQNELPAKAAAQETDDTDLSPFARWMQQRSKEIAFEADARPMPEGEQPEDASNWLRRPLESAETGIEDRLDDLSPDEEQGLIAHSARRMEVPQKKDHQKTLIDRFIQLEPRITPGKAADYSISDLAKESLEDDMEFVTETMAQLFVLQGKIDRAKKAFKKLMVLHPEKSVYFATQLKNIDRIKKL